MTSWLQVPRAKKGEPAPRPLFFQAANTSYTADFLGYFYAKLFASRADKELNVYDTAISPGYSLIKNSFEHERVNFVDSIPPSSISLSGQQNRLLEFLVSLKADDFHKGAEEFLQWNASITNTIQETIQANDVEGPFDFGVHLARNVPISLYISALKQAKVTSIFVLADTPDLLSEFRRRAEKSWNIVDIPPITGRPTGRTALQTYTNFVSNLYVLQRVPKVISVLSSPVGKFLFLTNRAAFQSLDTNTFTFF
jgi:hypothetical protein